MKLEPRIERLEARVPAAQPVTVIRLVDPTGRLPDAVSRFEDGQWTGFDMGLRR
jgi:hypothetical protein